MDLSERLCRDRGGVQYYDHGRTWYGKTRVSPAFGEQAVPTDVNRLVTEKWPVVHRHAPGLLPDGNRLADRYLEGPMELTWADEVVCQWEAMSSRFRAIGH